MKQDKKSEQTFEYITLESLISEIWNGKWVTISFSTVFFVFAIIYAMSLPNIYKATTIVLPVKESNISGLDNIASQLGGFASMAGLNLGSNQISETNVALSIIKSRVFLEDFITRHNILIPLMAGEGWSSSSGDLIIDPDIYDQERKEWVKKGSNGQEAEPSPWEAYQEFKSLLSVSKDSDSGLITFSLEFYSPDVAKRWLQLLINDINENMRESDKAESSRNILYLQSKAEQTNLAEMKSIFYELIEQQMKTVMLAEVNNEYIFKTIDPSNVPDEKSKPSRALIVITFTFLGGFLGILRSLFMVLASR